MLTHTKAFNLTIAALLVLALMPGAPFGYAAGEPVEPQDKPTTAAPPEPLSALSDAEAAEPHPSDFSAPLNEKGSTAAPSAPSAVQTDAENVEFVGHIGGVTYAMAVQGNYAYIGEGGVLTILDISSPASPTMVGETAPFPGIVGDIYISGNYAYVVTGDGLYIINVSDPTVPSELGFCDTPGYASDVAVVGDYAYVTAGHDGL